MSCKLSIGRYSWLCMVTETILDYITFRNWKSWLLSPFPCDSYLLSKHNMLTENLLSGSVWVATCTFGPPSTSILGYLHRYSSIMEWKETYWNRCRLFCTWGAHISSINKVHGSCEYVHTHPTPQVSMKVGRCKMIWTHTIRLVTMLKEKDTITLGS